MSIYKKMLLISILSLSIVGCGNNDNNNNVKEDTYSEILQEGEVGDVTEEIIEQDDRVEELTENEAETLKPQTHDAGYTELIHGGFSIKFQELMETIYSKVNYHLMGIAVEELTPMDESVMIQVEEMMSTLNPIQDGEILGIVKEARQLFDKANAILEERKYELLSSLDEEGQALYNKYYDWLIEVANHHDHEH